MFTGLQGQKIMYTRLFMGKVCRKNPGFDKDKTDVMFGLTLYDFASFIPLYVRQDIKVPFKNKAIGPCSKKIKKIKLLGLMKYKLLKSFLT